MAEENTMSEESKKTIISFIAGLLIGGLLMFIFIEPAADTKSPANDDQEQASDTTNDDNTSDEEDANNDDNSDEASDDVQDDYDAEPVVTSDGDINVEDQAAGSVVELDSVEYPAKTGWIGVRDYVDGQMTGLLGVVRFDTNVGLAPESVTLLRPTVAGNTYAVVFYSENGDKKFSLATDSQLSGVMETFKAK